MAKQPSSNKVILTRVTNLNASTNAAVVGAQQGYVLKELVVATISPQIASGDEVTQQDGEGNTCASSKASDSTTRYNVTLQTCTKDPYFEYFLRGGNLLTQGGIAYGYDPPAEGLPNTKKVAVEFWTYAWDGAVQAVTAVTSPNVTYFHNVLGLTTGWVPGDTTYDKGIPVFSFTGQSVGNAALTANGPYNDWPSYVTAEGGILSGSGWFQDSSIPTGVTGLVTTPSGS